LVFKKRETATKVCLDHYALNRKQTTYEPRQAETPLKFALLSNSAKIPCIYTQTLRALCALTGNRALLSPIGAKSVHPHHPDFSGTRAL
jgi:hypothetical protein